MKLTLERTVRDDTITMGKLRGDGWMLCTLENPWLNNEPYVSCIPVGYYECKRVDSPRYGNTFEVTDVEGRTHILFHWGNWEKNTLGCILVGTDSNWTDMIMSSRKAFGEFIKYTQGVDQFVLEIRNE